MYIEWHCREDGKVTGSSILNLMTEHNFQSIALNIIENVFRWFCFFIPYLDKQNLINRHPYRTTNDIYFSENAFYDI